MDTGVSNNEGLSPLSSLNNNSSGPPQTTQGATLPSSAYSYQAGSWPTPGSSSSSSYVYTTSNPEQTTPLSQPSAYSNTSANANTGRGMYSPSMNYNARGSSQSPATGNDNMPSGPPPPASYSLPPYSSSSTQSTIPSHTHQQQPILSSQAPAVSQPPQQSTTPIADSYPRPPPPQAYYTQTSTPQQQTFQSFASHQPSQHSPASTAMASRGLVSMPPHSPAGLHPPPSYGPPRQFHGYHTVPHSMGGGVLSNITSPNTPMTLVNGGLGVHHPGMYSMYGHPPPTAADRPFKCDQCPQSFNRNHDLKRHKRIHLAVKPFPCSHCDKSFSRKDALKRHKLVKGCGSKDDNTNNAATTNTEGTTTSNPNDGSSEDPNRTTGKRDPAPMHP
ncbi:putative zinc finger protein [Zalerion maritima]|uniref:Zinc finger protein n=1 Tax=Zalerion maritima TaxID=339359 RepID=A0AAD5WNF0_9PEZI|nr:putative zinc finger protein [Zalerion maritima]